MIPRSLRCAVRCLARGAQLAELNGTATGFDIDALGGRGAVAPDIKPVITEQASFCGVAVTCHVGPADNLAVFAALPLLQAGDVIVEPLTVIERPQWWGILSSAWRVISVLSPSSLMGVCGTSRGSARFACHASPPV